MFDNVRKAMLFGMGAAALSWEKIKESVDELVSHGDITADEGKKLYDELTTQAAQEGHAMNERIRAQIRDMLKDMGIADRTQIFALEARIGALESRVNELTVAMEKSENP